MVEHIIKSLEPKDVASILLILDSRLSERSSLMAQTSA